MKIVTEQGKAISELTQAVKDLATQTKGTSAFSGSKPRAQPKLTEDGKPICFQVQTEGHIAKNCPKKRYNAATDPSASGAQGNGNSWL